MESPVPCRHIRHQRRNAPMPDTRYARIAARNPHKRAWRRDRRAGGSLHHGRDVYSGSTPAITLTIRTTGRPPEAGPMTGRAPGESRKPLRSISKGGSSATERPESTAQSVTGRSCTRLPARGKILTCRKCRTFGGPARPLNPARPGPCWHNASGRSSPFLALEFLDAMPTLRGHGLRPRARPCTRTQRGHGTRYAGRAGDESKPTSGLVGSGGLRRHGSKRLTGDVG